MGVRCDGCGAVRAYGKPLHEERVTHWPGPRQHIIFLCEMCSEDRAIALWPEEWEPYQPTMHRPHLVKQ